MRQYSRRCRNKGVQNGQKPEAALSEGRELLEEFSDVAMVAAGEINGEWCPDNNCGDVTSKNKEYFSTGQLNQLAFNSAAVYYDPKVFSSVEILLNSTKRVVNVSVRMVGRKLVAEKIFDRLV